MSAYKVRGQSPQGVSSPTPVQPKEKRGTPARNNDSLMARLRLCSFSISNLLPHSAV